MHVHGYGWRIILLTSAVTFLAKTTLVEGKRRKKGRHRDTDVSPTNLRPSTETANTTDVSPVPTVSDTTTRSPGAALPGWVLGRYPNPRTNSAACGRGGRSSHVCDPDRVLTIEEGKYTVRLLIGFIFRR